MLPPDALDNPVRACRVGAHRRYAVGDGNALAYRPGYSPFTALPDEPTEADWASLARLVGSAGVAVLFDPVPPVGWTQRRRFDALRMVTGEPAAGRRPHGENGHADREVGDAGLTVLGPADRDEVLDLAARTEPGPFLPRTLELAGRLVRAVVAGAAARGDGAFLHVMGDNGAAVRLYASLGFVVRAQVTILALSPPGRA